MRRRTLLASVAGATAGCLGTAPGTTPAPDGSPTPTGVAPSGGPGDDIAYRVTDLAVSTATDRPEARLVLEPSAFYSAEAVERERDERDEPVVVMDVAEVENPEAREAVETALREGTWRADELPDGLAALVERVDFFTGVPHSSTHTHVGLTLYRLHPDRQPALSFDARIVDDRVSSGDPGTVEFALENVGQRSLTVFSGTVPPFGVVRADRVDGGDGFLLWRDYEEEGCVSFTDDGVVRCAIGRETPLEPGGTVVREYDVLPPTTPVHPDYTAPPGAGRYRTTEELSYYRTHGAPESTLSADVRFTLAEE